MTLDPLTPEAQKELLELLAEAIDALQMAVIYIEDGAVNSAANHLGSGSEAAEMAYDMITSPNVDPDDVDDSLQELAEDK